MMEQLKKVYSYIRYGGGSIVAFGFAALPFYLIIAKGVVKGFHLGALIWSFFVLCLPFGFASSVFSIPFWLSLGRGFAYSELASWICAIALNAYTLSFMPELYLRFASTHLLYRIITNPWPYWCIMAANLWAMLYRTFLAKTKTWQQFFIYQLLNFLFIALGISTLLYLTYHELVIIMNIQS